MLTHIGGYVRFGLGEIIKPTYRNGVLIYSCGMTCGSSALGLILRDWIFDHV